MEPKDDPRADPRMLAAMARSVEVIKGVDGNDITLFIESP